MTETPTTTAPGIRFGLRVGDVPAASAFYRGLGFCDVGSIPGSDGDPVLWILERNGVYLIVDALVGLPFPDSERERETQRGPRGLGVAIGLQVDDLDAMLDYCTAAGCEITSEPMDMPWGDRVFECIDPFGYVWEMYRPIDGEPPADGLAATSEAWFGSSA
ncbi:MAG TPA: VOC family protein [Ilumatobacteraceae bacterium]|nr:VOC family protein [Ilumatobacteraceae bacterium]